MAQQSERQVGAFTALYYKHLKELPDPLPQNAVEFRNNVTHKGYFPSKEETYNYAFQVAKYVKAIISRLTDNYGFDQRGNFPALNELRKNKLRNQGERIEGHFMMTVITQFSCGNGFDESIELFKKQFHNNYEK